MATSINSVMNIGNGALFASQTAIQTTGNNIANVNTIGYSRQAVRFEEWPALDYSPGQMGQGVKAAEVFRYFDKFVERNYLNTFTDEKRWEAQYTQLRNVESLFNEANTSGISKLMQSFFGSWSTLSQDPSSQAAREDVLNKSQTLTDTIKNASQHLSYLEGRVDDEVSAQVTRANQIMQDIASLNISINTHLVENKNNPNAMLDERDKLTRELSSLIDVDVINKDNGDYIVNTKSGYTLVDSSRAFALEYRGAGSEYDPIKGSTFDGAIHTSGIDGYEYTLEITGAGGSGVATFQASLDGGKTWISDELGNPIQFTAYDDATPVSVKDLDVSFDFNGTSLAVGDKFHVTPKPAVYWIEPTRGAINISPQVFQDGTLDQKRITGGAIAGNLIFKDYQAEQYRDQLDNLAKTFIFEVNRIHTQGAGLEAHTSILGDYRVGNLTAPLGAQNSGFTYKDNIQSGNFVFAIYGTDGKPVLLDPGVTNAATINFDPATDSLTSVVAKINGSAAGTYIQASIVDNRLQISSLNPDNKFAVTDDTTGLLAGLGLNNFFKGDSSGTIELAESVVQNRDLINAAKVNGGAEFNAGDNQIAKDLAKLAEKKVEFTNWTGKNTTQTVGGYFSTLVSNIGGDTAAAKFSNSLEHTKASELDDRQSEISGVNLDEEMSNLIKFQASYKAAAKLITTADEMLQTILSLKQ